MGPPDSDRVPRVPPYSGTVTNRLVLVSRTGLSPAMAWFSNRVPLQTDADRGEISLLYHCPTTPILQRLIAYTGLVWAVPRSLAATEGIAFAFSS